MCNDFAGTYCLRPQNFYVSGCLFDEMVKVKYSEVRCHEEIIVRLYQSIVIESILCLLILLVIEQFCVTVVQLHICFSWT